jgi:hypothetical protein
VARLKGYLRKNPPPDLHHRTWLLWASLGLDGLLAPAQREQTIKDLLALQRDDGGWSLPSLGAWKRRNGKPNDKQAPSDGYATGLVVYVLRQAGVGATREPIRHGVDWLKTNQRASGRWFTRSLNADRGHLITNAGTAYAVLALKACNVAEAAAGGKGQDKSATPAEQYKALLEEYQKASGGGVLSDVERMKFVGRVFKHRNKLAQQFVELAEKYPKDPIALAALMQAVWQVNTTPWPVEIVGKDSARVRAFALLQRDHVRSDKLGPVCQRLSFGFCKEYETFLRTVLAKNPHKDVQGLACLGLAHFLSNRLQRIDLVKEQAELAREFEGLFGKEYLQDLLRQDRARVTREAEVFFEQAVEKYGSVKIPGGGTVGEKARAELFEIRHLRVGMEAPDIEGEDQDGKRFKLSDYRGKVVLLDFWHQQ